MEHQTVDYAYYTGTFGGSAIPAESFEGIAGEAAEILLALLYPRTGTDFTAEQREAFRRAVCYEAEYLLAGHTPMNGGPVKSEKLGDYAVEYGTGGSFAVAGAGVSPTSCCVLRNAGLLSCWI